MNRLHALILLMLCTWSLGWAIPPPPIKVGVVLPLTGGSRAAGASAREGFVLAERHLNQKGGVVGRPLQLVIADSASDPRTGVAAAQRLVRAERVALLAGGVEAATARAIARYSLESGVPFVISGAAASNLTRPASYTPDYRKAQRLLKLAAAASDPAERQRLQADSRLLRSRARATREQWPTPFPIFRLNPTQNEYLKALRQLILPGPVAVITSGGNWGELVRSAADGREPLLELELSATGFPTARLRNFQPETLLLAATTPEEAVRMLKGGVAATSATTRIVGAGPGFAAAGFKLPVGIPAARVVILASWRPELELPGVSRLVSDYTRETGMGPDSHAAYAYATVQVIVAALKRSPTLDPPDLRRALEAVKLSTVVGMVDFRDYQAYRNQNRNPPRPLRWTPEGALELLELPVTPAESIPAVKTGGRATTSAVADTPPAER